MSINARKKSFTVGATALTQHVLCKTPSAAVVTAAKSDAPFGVVQDGADASGLAVFVTHGPTKLIAGAAIAKGANLMPTAAGKVLTHDGAAGSVYIGKAEEAASGDGSVFPAFVELIIPAAS